MNLYTAPYLYQSVRWPTQGRHILCQYTDETVVVYQAYSPTIGHFAATHGYFGEEFSLDRMSWIKPNFLWMMYRSAWGTKENQEVTLAIHRKRSAFDEMLRLAVHSSFIPDVHKTEELWKQALQQSDVRLQWDPDHAPHGAKWERRAIQLGLRGSVLARYAKEWIVKIEDISAFVTEQRQHVQNWEYHDFTTPQEWVYWIPEDDLKKRLGIATSDYGLMTPIEELRLDEKCSHAVKRSGLNSIEETVEFFNRMFDEHGYPRGTFSLGWMFCFDAVEDALALRGLYIRPT